MDGFERLTWLCTSCDWIGGIHRLTPRATCPTCDARCVKEGTEEFASELKRTVTDPMLCNTMLRKVERMYRNVGPLTGHFDWYVDPGSLKS